MLLSCGIDIIAVSALPENVRAAKVVKVGAKSTIPAEINQLSPQAHAEQRSGLVIITSGVILCKSSPNPFCCHDCVVICCLKEPKTQTTVKWLTVTLFG